MEDFEKELKLDFLDEATQLLENTEQAFLQLENDLHNKELIDEIFRFAHNLKGTSRAVGFGVVAEFTHEVENLILKLKQEEIEITDHIVSVLLECNDHITTMIAELKENFDASFESSELVTKVQAAIDGNLESLTDNSTTPVETVALEETSEEDQNEQEIAPDLEQASFEVDEELINHELLAELEAMNSSGTETEASKTPSVPQTQEVAKQEDSLPGLNVFKGKENISKEESPKNNIADPTKPKLKEEKKIEKDESIRVSLSRVEALNNFVGELVILQSVLEQQKYIGIQDELAIKSIGQLSKLSKEIQEISMSLRMIPVKTTLQKMSRIVRDT